MKDEVRGNRLLAVDQLFVAEPAVVKHLAQKYGFSMLGLVGLVLLLMHLGEVGGKVFQISRKVAVTALVNSKLFRKLKTRVVKN